MRTYAKPYDLYEGLRVGLMVMPPSVAASQSEA